MAKILITYYTKTNTTKEIAEYIAEKLLGKGEDVTVEAMNQVSELKSYDTVVLGAPINGMNWAEDAKKFVTNHTEELRSKNIALFFNGYLYNNSYKMWNSTINKSLNKIGESLNTTTIGKFGGRVDKAFSGFPKLLFGSKADAPLDRRDWTAVDEFSEKL